MLPFPCPLNTWFRIRLLTQIRLLRYKMFSETSSGTAHKMCSWRQYEASCRELAAAKSSNIREPAWGQTREQERNLNWCPPKIWNLWLRLALKWDLLLNFSLTWNNKSLYCISQFELIFLFSHNQMYAMFYMFLFVVLFVYQTQYVDVYLHKEEKYIFLMS